jgi:nucleoid-associated protein YgaU
MPVAAGASGGWQVVDRPRQQAITQWYDASPMSLKLDLILDGGASRKSVEGLVTRTLSWQYPTAGAQQPPVLEAVGPIPASAKAMFWVLESIEVDADKVIRNSGGDATQEMLTLTLWQYVPATASVLTALSPAQAAQLALTASGTSTARKNYTVKSGDTLAKIAARVLGSASLWQEIALLNNIRDPSAITVGQRLVLPSS